MQQTGINSESSTSITNNPHKQILEVNKCLNKNDALKNEMTNLNISINDDLSISSSITTNQAKSIAKTNSNISNTKLIEIKDDKNNNNLSIESLIQNNSKSYSNLKNESQTDYQELNTSKNSNIVNNILNNPTTSSYIKNKSGNNLENNHNNHLETNGKVSQDSSQFIAENLVSSHLTSYPISPTPMTVTQVNSVKVVKSLTTA